MELIELLKTVILGIIQGITEWLPISSTGHMILFNSFFPMEISLGKSAEAQAFWGMFLVVIQLASIAAVCLLYFHKLNPFSPRKSVHEKRQTWSLWFHVAVASIPLGVIGLLINDFVEEKLQTAVVVAIMLIIYGIAFLVQENRKRKPMITRLDQIDYKTAFSIGFFQLLAVIPGTSRSGASILGGTLFGCSRPIASEFSFFCAIPAMIGASGYKLLKYVMKFGFSFTGEQMLIMAVAMIVSFIVSVFAIRFLMNYIRKHDFKAFGYYRIIVGILILICYFMGFGLTTNV